MAKIQVNKPFVYNGKGGIKTPFAVGIFTVEDEVANHWFVKAHCDILEDEEVQPKKNTKKK